VRVDSSRFAWRDLCCGWALAGDPFLAGKLGPRSIGGLLIGVAGEDAESSSVFCTLEFFASAGAAHPASTVIEPTKINLAIRMGVLLLETK